MKLLLFAIYALGFTYALFGVVDRLQGQQRSVESLFWSVAAAVINTAILATALTLFGCYRFWLLLGIQFLEMIGIAFAAARQGVLYSPKAFWARLKTYRFHTLAAIIVAAAFLLYALFPANFMMSGRDQGVYIIQGIHISEEGQFGYESDEFLNENFHTYRRILSIGFPAFYSDYGQTMKNPDYLEYPFGQYFQNPQYGDITPQFMPAFPSLLAVAYDVGGLSALFRVNAVVAVFALLALYYLARRFFGKTTAWLCLLFLAICPAQIWTARITLTEILAQFLFFTACYLLAAGWQEEKKRNSILGGLLLGFSLFIRIDVYIYGLGLLFIASYLAIWNRNKFRYLLPAILAYTAFGVFTAFWALLNVRPYFVELFRSGSLKLVTIANLALLFLLAVCFIIGHRANRKKLRKDWMSAVFASRSGAICIAGFFIAAILYLYFVRPLPIMQVEGSYTNESDTMKQLEQIFHSRSLIEFSWYTSVTAVLFSIYGLYRYLRDRREKVSHLLVFFALSISNLMVYLYNPAIYPDHIWASRRWIGVCMPFVFLLAAYGISQIRLPRIKKYWNHALRAVSALLITGFLLYQSSPFLFVKILGGVANQYEALVEELEDDEVYFTTRPEYAAYLRFAYGKNVYQLNENKGKPGMREFVRKNDYFNYIGENPYKILNPFEFDVSFVSAHQISGPYLVQTTASYPRECQQAIYEANIYRIMKKEDPLAANLPLAMFQSMGCAPRGPEDSFRSDGSGNTLLFGPYISLQAGEYTAEFTFRLDAQASGELARVDYSAGAETFTAHRLLYASDFSSGEYTLRLPVSLSEDVEDFEVRVFPNPGVELEVTGVTLFRAE